MANVYHLRAQKLTKFEKIKLAHKTNLTKLFYLWWRARGCSSNATTRSAGHSRHRRSWPARPVYCLQLLLDWCQFLFFFIIYDHFCALSNGATSAASLNGGSMLVTHRLALYTTRLQRVILQKFCTSHAFHLLFIQFLFYDLEQMAFTLFSSMVIFEIFCRPTKDSVHSYTNLPNKLCAIKLVG